MFTTEDLKEQGAPNVVEFTRNLPQASEALGEPNIDLGGTASGSVTLNLRGLGAGRSLVLVNGRRTSGDLNFLPMNAVGRVEVLKDGAGVTYGAGAVGGVMNFVTRDRFDGLEIDASHKFIAGSDGASDLSILWGKSNDRGGLILSAMIQHEEPLNFTDRWYGQLPFSVNPTQYIALSVQPGSYNIPTGLNGNASTTSRRVNDFTPAGCETLGGTVAGSNAVPECYYYYTPFFNFVDKQTNYRLFASANYDVLDSMNVHFDMGYSRTQVPKIWAAPTLPVTGNHRAVVGGNLTSCVFNQAFGCQYQIPIRNGPGAGTQNPFIGDFYARNLPNEVVPASGMLYTGTYWEPWGMNGNPLYPGGARYESRVTDRWQGSFQIKGEFTADSVLGFLDGVSYDYAVTGGVTRTELTRPDVVVSRLQNALRGYGGPDCAVADDTPTNYATRATYDNTTGIQSNTVQPGTGGCEWFNPFSSSYAQSGVNGAANPFYAGAAHENSLSLVDWIIADRATETRNADINVDALYSGAIPRFELPGGKIGWAAGLQYRATSLRGQYVGPNEFATTTGQLCPYPTPGVKSTTPEALQVPGQIGCVDSPGAFGFDGPYRPNNAKQKITSTFAELRLPVLDTVEAQLAVRREDYDGIAANVYKVAAKWDPISWLGFRGSWSTNYAPPPLDISDTTPRVGASYISSFTTSFATTTQNIPGIRPEEAVVRNVGLLIKTDKLGADSLFNLSLDYFNIDIKDQIVTTSVNTVLNNVAPVPTRTTTLLNSPISCTANLIDFVRLAAPCVQGATTVSDITNILAYQTNGPGTATSGFDLGVAYIKGIWGGDFSTGLSATLVTEYAVQGYDVNGVPFDTGGDRLGYSNQSRSADFSSKLRGNVYAGFRTGPHTFRAQVNYTAGVKDELATDTQASSFGRVPKDYIDLDLHYRFDMPWVSDSELRLSVLNVTDEAPMLAQLRNSYYTGVGNARGRQIEVGVSKKF